MTGRSIFRMILPLAMGLAGHPLLASAPISIGGDFSDWVTVPIADVDGIGDGAQERTR